MRRANDTWRGGFFALMVLVPAATSGPPRPPAPAEPHAQRRAASLVMTSITGRAQQGLAAPEHLSELARATLHRRMERHGQDMADLVVATALLRHELIVELSRRITNEPRIVRPRPGAEDELNAALPERFFVWQDELQSRARVLTEAARGRDHAALGRAIGRLTETCVACHAAYLEDPPRRSTSAGRL